MLEDGRDQAFGLRACLPKSRGLLLPILGAPEHWQCIVYLLEAMGDVGLDIAVLSDCPRVLSALALSSSARHLKTRRAQDLGGRLEGLTELRASSELTLFVVGDERLVLGPYFESRGALAFGSADREGVATAYTRIKALAGNGLVASVRTVMVAGIGKGSSSLREAHQRLADTVARFLGLNLEFGGAAPHGAWRTGYRQLANEIGLWAAHHCEGGACPAH